MISVRRFATFFWSLVLISGMASASSVTLLSVGNGTGLSDGANYVGFATLMIDGNNYSAMCIDSLHEASIGATWSGDLISLTDTVGLTPAIQAQFGALMTPAVFNPKLGTDVVAYYMMLTNPGNDAVINLQHGAWGQFDTKYDGRGLAAFAALTLADGFMGNDHGQTIVSIKSFSIVTDSSNLRQAFIVASTSVATPEPVSLTLMGAGLVLVSLLRRQGRG